MNYPFFKEGSYTFFTREAILAGGTFFPKMLNIEPTNECNLACVMCPRRLSSTPLGRMPLELYRRIIDGIASSCRQLDWLTLHNDGEPLLHPDIGEMVRYAKATGVARYVHFNTNGLLLGRETALALVEAGLDDLTVSVDAVTRETYAAVKGGGELETVVANTLGLMELKEEMGRRTPRVRAKIIEMEATRDEIVPFRRFWEGRVDEVQVQPLHNAAGFLPGGGGVTVERRYPCSLLWYAMSVRWNGEVAPCCVDLSGENVMGDLRCQSVEEVFLGRFQAYRLAMEEGRFGDLRPCATCTVWRSGIDLFG